MTFEEIGDCICSRLTEEKDAEYTPTIDITQRNSEYNRLDGRFEWKGKNYGMEAKWLSNVADEKTNRNRFFQYDDLMVMASKVEYALNEGKDASGLTASYFVDWSEWFDCYTAFVVQLEKCVDYPKRPVKAPRSHYDDKGYDTIDFYFVPRSIAKFYTITNDAVVETDYDSFRSTITEKDAVMP